jgi:hypothetical protein
MVRRYPAGIIVLKQTLLRSFKNKTKRQPNLRNVEVDTPKFAPN